MSAPASQSAIFRRLHIDMWALMLGAAALGLIVVNGCTGGQSEVDPKDATVALDGRGDAGPFVDATYVLDSAGGDLSALADTVPDSGVGESHDATRTNLDGVNDPDSGDTDSGDTDSGDTDSENPDSGVLDSTNSATVRVGGAASNSTGFIPFSQTPVPILPGWQGLQHIWVSFRFPAALWPGGSVPVSVSLFHDGSSTPLPDSTSKAKLVITPEPKPSTWVGYDGVAAVVRCPCFAATKPVRVSVTIALPSGSISGSAITAVTWPGVCTQNPTGVCTK